MADERVPIEAEVPAEPARHIADVKLSDLERATELARDEGRAEVLRVTGRRLLAHELHARCADRGLSEDVADALFQALDVGRFTTAEGDVDAAAVARLLDAIPVRQAPRPPVDLGQGARQPIAFEPAFASLLRRLEKF